jgi:hypothetical protein
MWRSRSWSRAYGSRANAHPSRFLKPSPMLGFSASAVSGPLTKGVRRKPDLDRSYSSGPERDHRRGTIDSRPCLPLQSAPTEPACRQSRGCELPRRGFAGTGLGSGLTGRHPGRFCGDAQAERPKTTCQPPACDIEFNHSCAYLFDVLAFSACPALGLHQPPRSKDEAFVRGFKPRGARAGTHAPRPSRGKAERARTASICSALAREVDLRRPR